MIKTLLLLAAFATATLAGAVRAEMWVAGPSETVLRTDKAPAKSELYDAKTKTVRLFAARNEFAAFQIVFGSDLKNVNVAKFELKGEKGAALKNVELFREHYLPCPIVTQYDGSNRPPDVVRFDEKVKSANAPREFPEQLVPLSATKFGAPFDVAAGKNEVVWVDIFVPEDAAPGEYSGSTKAGDETLNIKLTVWNFTLPSVSHFPQWANMGPEEIAWGYGKRHTHIPEMQATFDSFFEMAHNHRFCLMEFWDNDESYVKSPARKYYDYITGSGFKGPFGKGVGLELVPIGNDSFANFFGLVNSEKWLNRAFVQLSPDEPGNAEAYSEILANGAKVKSGTGGKLMRMATKHFMPNLDEGVDIFCSAPGALDPKDVPTIEGKGNVCWTYNGGLAGTPVTDAPAVATRTHAWAGFLSGARAWYYWDACYYIDKQFKWKAQRRAIYGSETPTQYLSDYWNNAMTFDETTKNNGKYPPQNAMRMNGEGILLYPGKDVGVEGPVANLRLKNLRQGSQDFEYLYLLEKMGKKEIATAEATKLVGETISSKSFGGEAGHYDNYDFDGAKWDAARIRLGKALDAIGDKALHEKITPYNQYPNPTGVKEMYDGKRY